MYKAVLVAALLGLAAAQAPLAAPSPAIAVIDPIVTLDTITKDLICPVTGTPPFTVADAANINTTYTAAITWSNIVSQPSFTLPRAPCDPANYTDESTVQSACSTPIDGGYVVITTFTVVLACGATTTVDANIFVGADSAANGQVLVRNYSTTPWVGEPSLPSPSPVVVPSPSPAVVLSPALPPSPTPGASPAVMPPSNETTSLSCPATITADSTFLTAPLTADGTIATAENTYDEIIASGKYPGVPAQCDPVNGTVTSVTEACSKDLGGSFISILTFEVSLSCGITANVSANVFVYNYTSAVYLRNYTIGPWSELAAPPSPPVPSPTPPPKCTFGVPFCRIYTEDVMCCKEQGLVTPANYATIRLVCSEFAPPPAADCFVVTGPSNASVISTDFGTYFEGRRYMVNWTADPTYNGKITIGLNQTAPQCALRLAQGACLADGQAYTNAVQTNDTSITAIADTGVYFSYISNAADLKYLDNMGWLNTENNATGCLMNTPNNLPADFYVRGWINFTTGIQANCTSGSGVTCTALTPAPAPGPVATDISGRRLL